MPRNLSVRLGAVTQLPVSRNALYSAIDSELRANRVSVSRATPWMGSALGAAFGAALLLPNAASAATITVNSSAWNDGVTGNCTLDEAVEAANTNAAVDACAAGAAGLDEILFDASLLNSTINVGSELDVSVNEPLDIVGPGTPDQLTVNGAYNNRFLRAYADVSVANLTARNFYSDNGGGAIYGGYDVSVTATNSRFENNRAYDEGGAIAAGSVTITNSQFVSNTTYDGDGGAISGDVVTVTDSLFEYNESDDDGGAISANDTLTATNSDFNYNRAQSEGGAVEAGYTATVVGSRFNDNEAYRYGGAISADRVQISGNSEFDSNSADFAGGAVFSSFGGSISDSSFSYNTAQAGGAVFAGYAYALNLGGGGGQLRDAGKARRKLGVPSYLLDLSITGSQFTRNAAAIDGPGRTLGGAIAVAPKYEAPGGGVHQVTLSGSQLTENRAVGYAPLRPAAAAGDKLAPGPFGYSIGGGLAVLHSGSGPSQPPPATGNGKLGVPPEPTTINVDIDDTTFDNNLSPLGGGAAVFASTITVDGSSFTRNGAYIGGGGLFSAFDPKYGGPPDPASIAARSLSFGETSFDGNLAISFAGVMGFSGSVSGDGLDLLNNRTAEHPDFDPPLRSASKAAGAGLASLLGSAKGGPPGCSFGGSGSSGKYGIVGGGMLSGMNSVSLSGGSQISGNCAAYAAGGVMLLGGKYGGIAGTVTVAADSVVSSNQANVSAPGMAVSIGPSSKYGGSGASGGSASISGSFTDNIASLSSYGGGGGLTLGLKYGASASVSQATISGNQAAQGGGIAVSSYSGPSSTVTLTSNLVVSDTTISGNSAVAGGGINLAGAIAPARPAVVDNAKRRFAGIADRLQRIGVDTQRLETLIERRHGTIAKSAKGATPLLAADLRNVTIDSNTTSPAGGTSSITQQGGGLFASNVGLAMDHVTITGNSTGGDGGGVMLTGVTPTVSNSIIALNAASGIGADANGTLNIDYSLLQDVTGATLNGANNLTDIDPLLDPLADNGGLTQTRLPQLGSPVVDAGDPAFDTGPLPEDQRGAGFPRAAGDGTDMGAVEGITPREVISIGIAPNPFAEGASSTMTVTLDGLAQVDTLVTVDFSGTAVLDTDFVSADADAGPGIQVLIAANSDSGSVQLDATADSLHEGDEPFTATVSAADFATIPVTPPSFDATITDGDALTFSIADASGAENIGNLDFTVSLNVPSTQAVSVSAMTVNGTALSGSDYTAVSTSVNFPAGSTSQPVSVPIIDDAIAESSETFNVNLSGPSTGSIADASATGTITDNEAAPTVSLTLTPPSNTEGDGSFIVTANLSGPSAGDVVVTLDFGGSADFGTDYTVSDQDPGTPGVQIIIPAGSTSSNVTVTPLADSENEPDEDIVVSIASASGAGATGAPGTGTIVNGVGTGSPAPVAQPELIPTLNEWMLMLLGLLLPAAVMFKLRGGRRDDKLEA